MKTPIQTYIDLVEQVFQCALISKREAIDLVNTAEDCSNPTRLQLIKNIKAKYKTAF